MSGFVRVNVPTSSGVYEILASKIQDKDRVKPYLVTIHDVAHNFFTNFCYIHDNFIFDQLIDAFTMININILGQEPGAPEVSSNVPYPSYSAIATNVHEIIEYFNIREFIGLGVGAGANILLRYSLIHQEKVRGLIMINPCMNHKTIPLFYKHLNSSSMIQKAIRKALLRWNNKRIRDQINLGVRELNKKNFRSLLMSHLTRTPIEFPFYESFKVRALILYGDESPNFKDCEELRQRWTPIGYAQFVKFDSIEDPMECYPHECSKSMLYFLQGLGYCMHVRWSSSSRRRNFMNQNRDFSDNSLFDLPEKFLS